MFVQLDDDEEIGRQLSLFVETFDPDNPAQVSLYDVHEYFSVFIKTHEYQLYELDRPDRVAEAAANGDKIRDVSDEVFADPYLELFIWATMCR
jgi:hypothetical protein